MKPIAWVASSKKDLLALPAGVVRDFGHALWLVQTGELPPNAKPLHGFGGASVLEISVHDGSGTYRTIYTVKFEDAIYVLHCFQKKSSSGIATPKLDVELIRSRLRIAEEESRTWREKHKKT